MRLLTKAELRAAYVRDLQEAFPPSELTPLRSMEELMDAGLYDPWVMENEAGEKIGYLLLWKHRGGRYLLIDYLCVPARLRGCGIGANLLRDVFARYGSDAVFIAESEAPTGDDETDGMIRRRLGFYQRNGAAILGYDTALFGVHFKTICWCEGGLPCEAEILRHHREIYLDRFGAERFARYIQIPLQPGERPFPVTDWVEE